MKAKIIGAILAIFLMVFTTSCANVYQEIATSLGEKNCTDKAKEPAGPNKRILLFAKNHIYVVGDGGKYNPTQKTINPYSKVPWKNQDLVNYRSKKIKEFFPKLNKILKDTGANIYVHDAGYDVQVVTKDKIQANMNLMGSTGKTLTIVNQIVKKDPTKIHILWFWTSSSAAVAVGESVLRTIVVGDDPKTGSKLGYLQFAHEFGHVLGYNTHVYNDPSNLMNDGTIGTKLTSAQLKTIWKSLNDPYDKLTKLSCDK